MNVSKIDLFSQNKFNSYGNKTKYRNPSFNANFAMKENVLSYVAMEAIINNRDTVKIGNYWKSVLKRLTIAIEPLEPKSANIYLNLVNNSGEAEILCTHPNAQGIMKKNIGNLKNTNLVNNIYDAVISATHVLKVCGYK